MGGPHDHIFSRFAAKAQLGLPTWLVPNGTESISEVTKVPLWGSALLLWSQAQGSPAHSPPCSGWVPTRPYPPAWRASMERSISEVTHSAGFKVVPPPLPFSLFLLSSSHSSSTLRLPTPALLVLFLQVVRRYPAFEGLHPIQDLAVPPAIGVPLQDFHGDSLLEACCLLIPLIVRN